MLRHSQVQPGAEPDAGGGAPDAGGAGPARQRGRVPGLGPQIGHAPPPPTTDAVARRVRPSQPSPRPPAPPSSHNFSTPTAHREHANTTLHTFEEETIETKKTNKQTNKQTNNELSDLLDTGPNDYELVREPMKIMKPRKSDRNANHKDDDLIGFCVLATNHGHVSWDGP